MNGYDIYSLDEIEAVRYHQRDGERLIPIQQTIGYRVAGVNGWLGDPGEQLVPEHEEDSDEELYVVVQGRATFTVDGVDVDAPAGTLIHLLAGENRKAFAEEPGTIVLAIGGTPGVVHVPGGWTSFVVADAYRRLGRLDDGREAIQRMLELHGDVWFAPYNAACFEALAGNADAAFELLAEAISRDPETAREYAQGDDDFASIRDDARWQEVVG
jgi:quercetin dioxygenase-like cupin family protein